MLKEGLNFDNEDREECKKEDEEINCEHKVVKEYLKVVLAGKVQRIKMTLLLSYNPADLMHSTYWTSPVMQQYIKALNVALGGSNASTLGSFNRAVLKVYPNHLIVRDLERMIVRMQGDRDIDARNFAILLYDVAALMSGYKIEDLGDFSGRILSIMGSRARSSYFVGWWRYHGCQS